MREVFDKYVESLKKQKVKDNKTGQWVAKNLWALKKPSEWFDDLFKKNKLTNLPFDGVHITINQHGLSYDYIAYKNRLLMAYPETKINFSEVYNDDIFTFSNNSDGVYYEHKIISPFDRDPKNIIGVYCLIKNKRGEFLTLLDKNEILKHKAVAKTQAIWNQWELEMIYKTVIKKATRIHYEDIYTEINDEDNKDIDIESLGDKRQNKIALIRELIDKTNTDLMDFLNSFKVDSISALNFENQDKAILLLQKKQNQISYERQYSVNDIIQLAKLKEFEITKIENAPKYNKKLELFNLSELNEAYKTLKGK
jgi:hypothetical protein